MGGSKEPIWRLKKTVAEARFGEWRLKVDARQPAAGIKVEHANGKLLFQLMGAPKVIVKSNEQIDPFARAGNLITAYPCSDERIFGGELSYRVRQFPDLERIEEMTMSAEDQSDKSESDSEALAIEFVYSIQTLLLDTQPQPEIVSHLVGESIEFFERAGEQIQAIESPENAIACLVKNRQQYVLLAIMPSDFNSLSLKTLPTNSAQSSYEINWDLPSEFLEKGVIRRFRAFSVCGTDRNLLLVAANAFYHSETPLTA